MRGPQPSHAGVSSTVGRTSDYSNPEGQPWSRDATRRARPGKQGSSGEDCCGFQAGCSAEPLSVEVNPAVSATGSVGPFQESRALIFKPPAGDSTSEVERDHGPPIRSRPVALLRAVDVLSTAYFSARSTPTASTSIWNLPGFLSLSMKPSPLIWLGSTFPMP